MLLTVNVSPNDVDWNLFGQLIIILMLGLAIAVQMKSLRRKPSLDVDLSAIQQSLEHVEEDLDKITQRLAAGDVIMGKLQVDQAVNSESIKNISVSLHELNSQVVTILSKVTGRRPS